MSVLSLHFIAYIDIHDTMAIFDEQNNWNQIDENCNKISYNNKANEL